MHLSCRTAKVLAFGVGLAYLSPIATPIAGLEGRPVQFTPSELLSLAMLPFLIWSRLPMLTVGLGALAALLLVIASTGSIAHGVGSESLVSAVRLCVPMASMFTGVALGRIARQGVGTAFGWAGAGVLLLVFAADMAAGSFPRGSSYEGRWGGWFGRIPVYGFPNASATFVVLSSGFAMLFMSFRARSPMSRAVGFCGVWLAVLLAPLTHSRSAVLAAVFLGATAFACACVARRLQAVTVCLCAVLLLPLGGTVVDALLSGIIARQDHLIERGDPTNGRTLIWASVAERIWESPIVGAQFRFVSTGTGHGSTHSQYLEWLYKAGLVGAAGLVAFWAVAVRLLYRRALREPVHARHACLVACAGIVLALATSAVFQSIVTYAPMANLCFLVVGVLAARSTEVRCKASWGLGRQQIRSEVLR